MSKPTFSPQNATLLLIDHQVGTMGWVRSVSFETMKRHAITLARSAAVTGMPVVLTSSQEERAQGPLLPELEKILPKEFAARIKRAGIVMLRPGFRRRRQSAGPQETHHGGVTNDVCTVYPPSSGCRRATGVQVVADAGSSRSQFADEIASSARGQRVVLTTTNQCTPNSRRTGAGGRPKLMQVLFEEVLSKL
jgi:nicotinamidase-related amidase